jgi:copper ion binding protein
MTLLETPVENPMPKTTLTVKGMTCNHCVGAVTRALEETPGVRSARVDLEGGKAVVDYDDALADPRELATVVAEAGYQANAED